MIGHLVECDCGERLMVMQGQSLWIAPSQRHRWGHGLRAEQEAIACGLPASAWSKTKPTRYVRVVFAGNKTRTTMCYAWFHESQRHKDYERQSRS